MSIRLQGSIFRFAVASLLLCVPFGSWAKGQGADPTSGNERSEVARPAKESSGERKNGLLQIEDNLRDFLKNIIPSGSSLDPMPQQRIRAPHSVSVRKPDKKEEWLKLLPNEQEKGAEKDESFGSKGFSELLNKKEGTEKKQPNSLEEFYDNLNRKNADKGNRDSSRDGFFRRDEKELGMRDRRDSEDLKLPSSLREAQRKLQEAGNEVRASIFDAPVERGVLSDVFGLGRNSTQPQPSKQANSYSAEYGQLLGISPLNSSTTPGQSPAFASSLSPMQSPASVTLDSALKPVTPQAESPMAWVNPNRTLTAAPNVNSTVLNQWNPLYLPPSGLDAQPARKLMAPPSTTDPLRRRF